MLLLAMSERQSRPGGVVDVEKTAPTLLDGMIVV